MKGGATEKDIHPKNKEKPPEISNPERKLERNSNAPNLE